MSTDLTPEQKKQVVIAYFASGNSVEALIEMLLELKYREHAETAFEKEFADIHQDMINAREDSPEDFVSTVEEEIETLLSLFNEHLKYAVNSPIIG